MLQSHIDVRRCGSAWPATTARPLKNASPLCLVRPEHAAWAIRCVSSDAEPQPEASSSAPAPPVEFRLRRRLAAKKTAVLPVKPGSDVEQQRSAAEDLTKRRQPRASLTETTEDPDKSLPAKKEDYNRPILEESNPYYQPALTDEDLEQDPPGHRSGYVAVIGKPNAGKSTLINALVGQKLSIVTYKPQTTRHRIMGIASDRDSQMILFDTPGVIERKRTKLEERMMAAVVHSIKEAEAIIAVVDCADRPKEALGMFQPGSDWNGPPMAVLLNKADLMTAEQVAELSAWYKENCRAEEVFVGSAERREGLEALRRWAVSRLPEGPSLYSKSIVSEQPEHFFVAECIREQVFLHCEQEVPYCTEILIRQFRERPGRKDYVEAEVVVEKESQVGIVVGAGGARLKRIGSEARREIETFLERDVFLRLSCKVAKDWRDDKEALGEYGYFSPMLM